jgi:hypothetical protein
MSESVDNSSPEKDDNELNLSIKNNNKKNSNSIDDNTNSNKNDSNNINNDEDDNNNESESNNNEEEHDANEKMTPLEILNAKDNNKELGDNNENSKRNELYTELKERETLYDNIVKSNKEIKEKINFTNKKYDDIIKRIEEKKNKDVEQKLKNQINEIDKEIEAYRNENKNYKKKIDQMKSSVYFKNAVANSAAMQNILKQEKLKNKEYISELNALKRIEKINKNYIANYEKDNKIKENIDYVNKEIKETKESIKQYTDDYNLLEKYFKLIHEKIIGIDIKMNAKKKK